MIAISALDISIIILALLFVFGTALCIQFKNKKERTMNIDEFFLADRNLSWWTAAASLFAANIGNEHFIGQAGTAADSGIAVALYEWIGSSLLILLGFVFGPVFIQNKVSTIPEYFELRFNTQCRIILAIISLFGSVLTKISASLFSGAILCEVVLGINFWHSLPPILLLTGLYTVAGGLTAVVYTEVLQMMIFTIGGIAASITSINSAGGWEVMKETFNQADLNEFPHAIRNTGDFAWSGMFFGQVLGMIDMVLCIDQEMAQRIIACKTIRHAKGASLAAGFLKLLPPFMIVFPGMAARVMYEKCISSNGASFPTWCDADLSTSYETNKAYPYLIVKTFPSGIVGLILVSMILSMMSALSAVFNSSSTIFTLDIYKRFINKQASDKNVVLVGRLFTLIMIGASFAWLFAIRAQDSGIYLITMNISTHISPPLAVVAIMGIFLKRINGQGALMGILSGVSIGVLQYILSLVYMKECHIDSALMRISCLHYNHFASILGILTFIITYGVSLMYPPPESYRLSGTRNSEIVRNDSVELDVVKEERKSDVSDPNSEDELLEDVLDKRGKYKDWALIGMAFFLVICVGGMIIWFR